MFYLLVNLEFSCSSSGQNYQLETCILEVCNSHIISKSTFSKDSYPLCHEDVVRSLEGLPNIHKDCHGSSGFDVRCRFISCYQLGHPILKPCCEVEHAGRHLGWQCV